MIKPDKSLTSSLSFSRNDYVNDLNTGSNSNKDITKSSLNLTLITKINISLVEQIL